LQGDVASFMAWSPSDADRGREGETADSRRRWTWWWWVKEMEKLLSVRSIAGTYGEKLGSDRSMTRKGCPDDYQHQRASKRACGL
jgi:hypothetical protein